MKADCLDSDQSSPSPFGSDFENLDRRVIFFPLYAQEQIALADFDFYGVGHDLIGNAVAESRDQAFAVKGKFQPCGCDALYRTIQWAEGDLLADGGVEADAAVDEADIAMVVDQAH